ncbi:SIS domain-containing protein [Streptomyces bambusae]|uniref:Sugar isomerase n=1 Tax=Streptomyces bambusae TaxID=1550616 RepID=A0ABS6Z901_9ACTN|nr:sugar isomerase [Streptomyces bambusae]MBW5484234.1 sugar isomerase [Streptomyces bambusae]
MSHVAYELSTQPACWERAAELAPARRDGLPRPGERTAFVGCGTSYYMAQAAAALREEAGHGETDAFAASEFPAGRRYDRVVALTRSGTTTEVLDLLAALRDSGAATGTRTRTGSGISTGTGTGTDAGTDTRTRTTVVVGDPDTPAVSLADDVVVLDFADEHSVVQTRFATTALTLLRAHVGRHTPDVVADGHTALAEPLPAGLESCGQFTFLGRGWSVGLAHEAALKMREASLSWSESYPAMEYRHGPISVSGPGTATWAFGEAPEGLAEQVRQTGAQWVAGRLDPLAELVRVHRLAVAVAAQQQLDPDRPRHLTRSVILTAGEEAVR